MNNERSRELGFSLVAPIFFFSILTAWLTWPLVLRMSTGLAPSPDSLLNHWALSWSYHILSEAPLELFDANIFFPRKDTLAYSEHLFGVVLVGAPAYLLSGNTVLAYNFAVFASFVLSGFGMYLLVRELSGSGWAAVFSGTVYAAAPYRLLHLLHVQILSYQWFPFVLYFLYRFLRTSRFAHLSAAAVFAVLQILSCNYYAVYLALAAIIMGVSLLAIGRRIMTFRKWVLLTAAAGTTAAASLPFFLPYERNRTEQGFYRRYEDVVQFSAVPSDYLRPTSYNRVFYARYLPVQQRSEKALFPGFAVVVLAILGLCGSRVTGRPEEDDSGQSQRLMRWYFAVLIVAGFVLSLGPQIEIGEETFTLPYRLLYQFVPGFRGMRVPARLATLVLLALGAFSGWGVARVLGRFSRWKHALGVAFVALALLEYQTYSLERVLPDAPSTPPVYSWLANQSGDFAVLELPIHEEITREAIRLYYSTTHWKRLANGFSGWWPNDYWVLVGRMRYFPTYRMLQFLERDVPVRYIVIHYDEFSQARRRRLEQDMLRYRDRLPLRARFGSDAVHERLPLAPAEQTQAVPR